MNCTSKQGDDNFQYVSEQFADLRIQRYEVPGFNNLTLNQKKLVYYLYQASLSGRDIIWDQNYKHNLYVRKTLEAIVNTYSGDKSAPGFAKFMEYAKRVWFSSGIHHHYGNKKFIPEFTMGYFSDLVRLSDEYQLPLQNNEKVDDLIKKLEPLLFDPKVDPMKVNLDPEAGRLYVPRSDRVMVLDLEGKKVGEVPDCKGIHGVAFSHALDLGWTSNGQDKSVTVFQLSTLKVLKVIKIAGENPDAIIFEPVNKRVFTFNGKSKNATVIDAVKGEVVGTIPIGGKPEFAAIDGKGMVYVNNEDTAEIFAIDAKAMTVKTQWSLKPQLEEPSGLAMDVKANVLFSVAGNHKMAVFDVTTGKLKATLDIGKGTDGVDFDPGTGCAFASNGEGTITVVKADAKGDYKVIGTIPTAPGARTIVANPRTHRLYLPTAGFAPVPKDAPAKTRPAMIEDSFKILEVGEAL